MVSVPSSTLRQNVLTSGHKFKFAFFFVCFVFSTGFNEAATQTAMQKIYFNHGGALFSLCFMACSCCSSISVFLSLVKCCHSPVLGCGPEGP